MTKEQQIANLVQTLAEIHRVQLTAPAARGYMVALEELSQAELREAGRRALAQCEHMPAPAMLLKLGLKARRDGLPSDVDMTTRRLEAMKPASLPTADELAAMRDDWRGVVRSLAETKAKEPSPSAPITEAEKRAAVERMTAQLAARGDWETKAPS